MHSIREDASKLGGAFRHQINFSIVDQLRLTPDQTFIRLRVLIEDTGVSVYSEFLGDDGSRGVSVYFNEFPAIIIDQGEKQPGAKSFTLMHEYCHLLVRQAGVSGFDPRNAVERFCNAFAAAFLLPTSAIEAAFPRDALDKRDPTITELGMAAKKLGVTLSQLALRLEELSRVKPGYYKRVVSALSISPERKKSGRPDYKYVYLSRFGHNLPNMVLSSLERGVIDPIEASRVLQLSPSHFPNIKEIVDERRDAAVISGILQ